MRNAVFLFTTSLSRTRLPCCSGESRHSGANAPERASHYALTIRPASRSLNSIASITFCLVHRLLYAYRGSSFLLQSRLFRVNSVRLSNMSCLCIRRQADQGSSAVHRSITRPQEDRQQTYARVCSHRGGRSDNRSGLDWPYSLALPASP